MRMKQGPTNQIQSLQSEQGFTLIETIIAVAVLFIGILALCTMQIQSIGGNSAASALTVSTNRARDRIEALLSRSYTHTDLDVGTHTITENGSPVVSISWNVTAWDSDGQDNDMDGKTDEFDEQGIKHIVLTVQYLDKGTSKQITTRFVRSEIF